MDSSNKSSNKITETVRLRQMLKEGSSYAEEQRQEEHHVPQEDSLPHRHFLCALQHIPKGSLAVCVGEEMKRFVIPTEYLSHSAFEMLLREAEEEFGFHQEGILRIPCEVSVFERILKVVEKNKEGFCYCSSEAEFMQSPPLHPKSTCT